MSSHPRTSHSSMLCRPQATPAHDVLQEGGCIQSGLLPLLLFLQDHSLFLYLLSSFLFHLNRTDCSKPGFTGKQRIQGYCYITLVSHGSTSFKSPVQERPELAVTHECWRGQVCTVSPLWFVCQNWQPRGVDLWRGRIVEGDWIMAALEKALCWPFGVN